MELLKKDRNNLVLLSEGNSVNIHFDDPITEAIVYKNKILVKYDSYYSKDKCNIVCLNANGEVVWRVQSPLKIFPEMKEWESAFTGFFIKDNDEIRGYTWSGNSFTIDKDTGEISNPHWSK